MTYEEIVAFAKKKVASANLKTYKGHLAAQINITGEGEGAFYIELNDAVATVEPYEYFDRDVILVSSADIFTAILDGKKSAEEAFTNGELMVEGNVEKALELSNLFKKKAAAKKAPAKKETAAKKTPAKKATTVKKETVAKKAPAKKAEVKKEESKKTVAAKPVATVKKPVAKVAVKATEETKKAAVATAKKTVAKKSTK